MMFTTANQSQRTVCRLLANKNEQVRKRQTLLANIKCWPTFWTHDRHLFANTVGKHMLANICLSCVRGFTARSLHAAETQNFHRYWCRMLAFSGMKVTHSVLAIGLCRSAIWWHCHYANSRFHVTISLNSGTSPLTQWTCSLCTFSITRLSYLLANALTFGIWTVIPKITVLLKAIY